MAFSANQNNFPVMEAIAAGHSHEWLFHIAPDGEEMDILEYGYFDNGIP